MEEKKTITDIFDAYENILKNDREKANEFLRDIFRSVDRNRYSEFKEELENLLMSKNVDPAVEMLKTLKSIEIPDIHNISGNTTMTSSNISLIKSYIDFPKKIIPMISKNNYRDILNMSHLSENTRPMQILKFIDKKNNSIAEIEVIDGKTFTIVPRGTSTTLRIMCYRGKVLVQESHDSFEMSVCCSKKLRLKNDQYVLIGEFLVRFVNEDEEIKCKYSVKDEKRSSNYHKTVNFGISDKGYLVFNKNAVAMKGMLKKENNKWEIYNDTLIYKLLHTKATKDVKFSLPLLVLPNMEFRIQDICFKAVFS